MLEKVRGRAILYLYSHRSDANMNMPVWIKPALVGAGVGAIALAIIGFNWGGWVSASTAQKQSDAAAMTAVTTVMTPYCLALAKSDINSAEVLTALKAASGYNRRGVIEKAGWATPLGADKPNSDLARACEVALAAL